MHDHIPARVGMTFSAMAMLVVPVRQLLTPKLENGSGCCVCNHKNLLRGHGHHHRSKDGSMYFAHGCVIGQFRVTA